jgi:hypothetical protein
VLLIPADEKAPLHFVMNLISMRCDRYQSHNMQNWQPPAQCMTSDGGASLVREVTGAVAWINLQLA